MRILLFLVFSFQVSAIEMVSTPYPNDKTMWEHLCSSAVNLGLPKNTEIAVIPHHFADQYEIAGFWKELGKEKFDLIIILSPDHFMPYDGDITIPRDDIFSTVFGDLKGPVGISIQASQFGLTLDNRPFYNEHGIFVHTSFVARYFPRTSFLPIIIKQKTEVPKLLKLLEFIKKLGAGKKVALVGSIDFSHYNPVEVSNFHDKASISAIENFQYSRVLDLEIDSPESLWVLLHFAEYKKTQKVKILKHTNLTDRLAYEVNDNTSHFFLAFEDGLALNRPSINLLIFPDLSMPKLSGQVKFSWPWSWKDPYVQNKNFPELERLRSEEDRFLMGSDLYIFGKPDRKTQNFKSDMVDFYSEIPSKFPVVRNERWVIFSCSEHELSPVLEKKIAEMRPNLVLVYGQKTGLEFRENVKYVFVDDGFSIKAITLGEDEGFEVWPLQRNPKDGLIELVNRPKRSSIDPIEIKDYSIE